MTSESLSPMWADGVLELCKHLWQSTLFLGIVALLALLLRKNQARVRYCLWMTASVKFLIPFSLLVGLGSHLPWPGQAVASKSTPYVAIEEMSQPFLDVTALNTPIDIPVAKPTASHVSIRIFASAMTAVWLTGSITMLIFWSLQWWRISRLVRSARPLIEGREVDLLRKAERLAKLPRAIPLLLSGNTMEPGIFGLFRPVLLWPEGIARHMDDAHLESVLGHEVCHVHRRDNLTSAVHMLVEAIFWFHPVVWWMERQLLEERERACDEAVLCLGGEPGDYAEAILRVCKLCVESPLTCISGISGADLKKRIIRITTRHMGSELSSGRKLLLVGVGIAAVAVPLLLGLANAAKVHAQSSRGESEKTSDALNQNMAGIWQGTLHSGKDRRVVFKIDSAINAPYRADFFDLDQDGAQTRVSSVTSQQGIITINLAVIGVSYTGTLSSDGNTISGSWAQGENPLPLVLARATQSTAWDLPAAAPLLPMMAVNAMPTLEVATIKPSKPDGAVKRILVGPRIQIRNSNLNDMIVFAYGLHPKQVIGAPPWAETEKFDVEAKPSGEGVPTIDQWRAMTQQLMADRYKLRSHREQRALPVYLLTVCNGGSKITKSGGGTRRPGWAEFPGQTRRRRFSLQCHHSRLHQLHDAICAT